MLPLRTEGLDSLTGKLWTTCEGLKQRGCRTDQGEGNCCRNDVNQKRLVPVCEDGIKRFWPLGEL